MTRVEHWDVRLCEWAVASRIGKAFEWGVTDCAILACEAVDILTGSALTGRYRGRYASAIEALRLQLREDVNLKRVLFDAGGQPVRRGFQQRGDILVVSREGFWCGHVCFGEQSLSSRPECGVAWFSTHDVMAEVGAEVIRIG